MPNDVEKIQMEYLAMEYNSLRNEIIERVKLVTQLEVFSMTAVGIIWGWAYSGRPLVPFIWIGVGAALVIVSGCAFVAFETEGIFRMGTYIAAKFEADPSFGISWETSNALLAKNVKAEYSFFGHVRLSRHSFYYLVLITINVLISIVSTIASFDWNGQDGLKTTQMISIAGVLIIILISLTIYFPIRRIEHATHTTQNQIANWKKVLCS